MSNKNIQLLTNTVTDDVSASQKKYKKLLDVGDTNEVN